MRDQLLALSGLRRRRALLLDGACPALARERDWCHDAAAGAPQLAARRLQLPGAARPLAAAAGASCATASSAIRCPRRAGCKLYACGPTGRHPFIRLDRHDLARQCRVRRARPRRRRPDRRRDGGERRHARRSDDGRGAALAARRARARARIAAHALAWPANVARSRKSFTIVPSNDPNALSSCAGVVGRMAASRRRRRAAVVLSFLRPVVDPAERGRVKAGIFFAGAYLVIAAGVRRVAPAAADAAAARLAARAVGAAVLASRSSSRRACWCSTSCSARREIPRILRDLVQGVAYFITAAIVLTRSEVDVTQGVHGVGADDGGHRPRAAGDAGQHHGRAWRCSWSATSRSATGSTSTTRITVGRIREVRWRATTIVTKNGDLMLIPNGVDHARHDHELQPADDGAPAVGQRARPLPPPAGARARGGRRGGARAVVRARRAAARLPAAGVQGRRLHLRVPLLDGRRPARRHARTATCAAPSGTRSTAPGWRSRSRR